MQFCSRMDLIAATRAEGGLVAFWTEKIFLRKSKSWAFWPLHLDLCAQFEHKLVKMAPTTDKLIYNFFVTIWDRVLTANSFQSCFIVWTLDIQSAIQYNYNTKYFIEATAGNLIFYTQGLKNIRTQISSYKEPEPKKMG